VVVVAAAGNEQTSPTRPASCAGVVGVGALARDGFKAWYSNFGARLVISTVGGDPDIDDGILTVSNTGTQSPDMETYARYYGTSFSAPIVSGVVSLMLSANAQLSVPQIISGLQVTARPHAQATSLPLCSATDVDACQCTTSTCGAGILDAEAAVRYAAGAPPDTGDDDSGGGALGWLWLLGLAAGVAALRASGPRAGAPGAQRKRLAE
jgi:serine protease